MTARLEKQREETSRRNRNAAALILGADLGGAVLGQQLAGKLMQTDLPALTLSQVQDLARRQGLNVDVTARRGWMDNAFFKPGPGDLTGAEHGTIGRVMAAGSSPKTPVDVAAHEIGHGLATHGRSGLLTALISRLRMPGLMTGSLGSAVGLFKGTSGNRSLAEREKWLNTASIAGGVGTLPMLADEALASRTAMKILRRLPQFQSEVRKALARKAALRLMRAWGSYGAGAGGLILGPQLAKQYYRRQHDRR